MKPDFSLLYSELELPPDCSLEQFQSAYRRRIAELHPDRAGVAAPSQEAQDALPALISTYVAVNRFHRRYGRMPGASPRHIAGAGNELPSRQTTMQMAPRANHSISASTSASDESEQSSRPTVKLVVLFLALLLLLASWDWVTLQAQ